MSAAPPDEPPRRSHRPLALGVVVALLWAGALAVASSPSVRMRLGLERHESWRVIAKAPIKPVRHTAVWTGEKMIVWGSTSNEDWTVGCSIEGSVGAIYDPQEDRWTSFPPGPLKPREGQSAIWTGSEMILWGGYDPCGDARYADGAAFDPTAGRWRRIAPTTLEPRGGHVAVWTGSEMLVLGHASDAGAYNPLRDSWRSVAAPRDRGTGKAFVSDQNIVVWSALSGGDAGYGTLRSRGSVYSIADDRWRRMEGIASGIFGPVWTGTELIVLNLERVRSPIDGDGRPVRNGAYDPEADRWRSIPPGPKPRTLEQGSFVGGDLGVWTGREALFWGDDAKAFDPSRNVWRTMLEPPRDCRWAPAIWTGREMIVWRGGRGGASVADFGDGLAYTPPSDPTLAAVKGNRTARPSATPAPWEYDEGETAYDYRCGRPAS
jgi:hypothetical protein